MVTFENLWDQILEEDGRELLEEYIRSGGDINAVKPESGWSVLHVAAENSDIDLIHALLEKGADVNLRDAKGNTPLSLAVDSDIDCAIQSDKEVTLDTTAEFIAAGADEHLADHEGKTPRDVAACYGPNALKLYDGVSRMDWSGELSLEAVHQKCEEIIRSTGVDVREVDPCQLSVARTKSGHDDPWGRFFIHTSEWYRLSRSPDFAERFSAVVRDGLKQLEKRRQGGS